MTRPSSLLVSIILHGAVVVAVAWWVPVEGIGMPGEGGGAPEFNAFLLDAPGETSTDEESMMDSATSLPEESYPEPKIEQSSGLPMPDVVTSDAFANPSAPAIGIQDLALTEPVKKTSLRTERSRRSTAGLTGSRAGGGGGSGHYTPPRYAHCPAPSYPPAARKAHQSGLALLRVSVDASGTVTRVSLTRSTGSHLLDSAAMASVRTWRFVPALLDKTPVAAEVEVPVRFLL